MIKHQKSKQSAITPLPGYVLTTPYIQENKVFISGRETEGEDKLSKIICVGESVIDSQGISRYIDCKEGDIIIHADSNKTFEIDTIKYRFVHFTEIHGILT